MLMAPNPSPAAAPSIRPGGTLPRTSPGVGSELSCDGSLPVAGEADASQMPGSAATMPANPDSRFLPGPARFS
jgi:hypothetical protein